ncbi:lanosterol synthase-like [Apostichopus japonicus]|uniref:lanosterol synthase-like n=1 Tax=Stichopus japonicus TaxID=307972 RepID=UPI003AB46F05
MQSDNDYKPRSERTISEYSDLTRWRLSCTDGKRIWHYVTEDETPERPQNMVEKYSLGLDYSNEAEKLPRAQNPKEAAENGIKFFSLMQAEDGHWPNDYSGPLFLMPGLIIVLYITKTEFPEAFKQEFVRYLRRVQVKDGGWSLHIEGDATVFGTALNYISMRLLGVSPEDGDMKRARKVLHHHGGAAAIPSWGKFWLCILNCYKWEGMHTMFPELWLMPSWIPAHPSTLWIHCRMVYIGMAFLYGKRYYAQEDELIMDLRKELFIEEFDQIDWPSQRDNIAKIDLYTPHSWLFNIAFGILDKYEPFRLTRFRKQALDVCLDHIKQDDLMTSFISIGPISKMINMLIRWLEDGVESEAFKKHVERVYDYVWMGLDGTNVQGTNGNQVWDTSFAAMAMLDVGAQDDPQFHEVLCKTYSYLQISQVIESSPDCVKYYRQYNKGGWAQTTREHGLVVSDTSAEALKAVLLMNDKCPFITERVSKRRLRDAVDILLTMVNPNGGFSSYENLRGGTILELLNPSEVFGDIMVDYTYTECTSSVLQALRHFVDSDPDYRQDEIWAVLRNAMEYIRSNQLPDGSFEGSWGVCFTYGTWFALEAFACMGKNYQDNTASIDVKKACSFLVSRQMEDGGWGEKFASCSERRYVQSEKSLVVNTSWALLGLMAVRYPDQAVLERGIQVLRDRQHEDGDWPQETISGVFNRSCAISYPAFKNIFPIWALGRYSQLYTSSKENQDTWVRDDDWEKLSNNWQIAKLVF